MNWCEMVMLLKNIITIFHKKKKYFYVEYNTGKCIHVLHFIRRRGPITGKGSSLVLWYECIPPIKDRM